MNIKNKLKLIVAIDILAVGILSLLLNEWRLCLILLFAIFMIWFLGTGEDKADKIYKLTALASVGFIEGCLVVFDIMHNSTDMHAIIMVVLCILAGLGVLYFSKYIPRYPMVEDEFIEHVAEKSGHFAFMSATSLMTTVYVFLFILYSNKMTYSVNVINYTVELLLLSLFNFAMFRNYLFKKYLS